MSIITCCRDAMALLTEDREGALVGVERVTFLMHLTVCGRCKSYRAQLDTTVEVLHAMPRDEPKAQDVEAILLRLDEPETPDD